MFDNQRLVTLGVMSTLEPALQNMLWYLVATMQVDKKDYLQVFELSFAGDVLTVEHSQEQPPYRLVTNLPGFKPVTARVYIIDDGTHSTMLLAEEY